MKPPFGVVRSHFPDTDSVGRDELYQWIGYAEDTSDPGFDNTCAIRMSLSLPGAGLPNPGSYPVKAGKYKGRMIETGQRRLSNWLVRHLGMPEKCNSAYMVTPTYKDILRSYPWTAGEAISVAGTK